MDFMSSRCYDDYGPHVSRQKLDISTYARTRCATMGIYNAYFIISNYKVPILKYNKQLKEYTLVLKKQKKNMTKN